MNKTALKYIDLFTEFRFIYVFRKADGFPKALKITGSKLVFFPKIRAKLEYDLALCITRCLAILVDFVIVPKYDHYVFSMYLSFLYKRLVDRIVKTVVGMSKFGDFRSNLDVDSAGFGHQ